MRLCVYTCGWVCVQYLLVYASLLVSACVCSRTVRMCIFTSVCDLVYVHVSVALKGRSSRASVSCKQMVQIETYGSHRVMVAINTTHTNTERMWVGQWGDISWITWSGAHPAVPGGMLSEEECWFTENKELTWADLMLFKLPCFYCFTDTLRFRGTDF